MSSIALYSCTPTPQHLPPKIVSGQIDWLEGQMRAVVVLRNDSYKPLKFDDYKLELQIFDEDEEKITTTLRHQSAGSELPPWDQDRIAFMIPDKEKQAKSGEVILMDSNGKVISKLKVLPAN